MGEALRRYREMARAKGVEKLSMSFAQVPVSGVEANLVSLEKHASTDLLWVTLQVFPEGALVSGGLPISSLESQHLQRFPLFEIGSAARMPGQLVWSGNLVRARAVPPKGLVFEVDGLALVRYGDEETCSTRIREALASGDVVHAAEHLGRPFSFRGVVAHGDRRGRTLGYPTANLPVPGDLACLHLPTLLVY